MTFIRECDMFGTSFQFTVYSYKRYKTNTGGIISLLYLLYLLFLIAFVFYTARELFQREHPISNQTDFTPEGGVPEKVLTYKDMIIAWRLWDNGLKTNTTDMFFVYFKTNGGKQLIPSKKCDEIEAVQNDTYFNDNKTEWFCVLWDSDKYTMQVEVGSVESYSIQVEVSNCNYTDPTNRTCSNISKAAEYLDNNLVYLDWFIPTYRYNDKNPNKKSYEYTYHQLDFGNIKSEQFYFTNINITDDTGWIFDNPAKDQFLAFTRKESDYLYTQRVKKSKYIFYKNILFLENDILVYTRRFLKIHDMFAQIGGIAQFLIIIIKLLTSHYNNYKRKEALFNDLFDFQPTGNKLM
jgi:hypothetical protein